MGQGGPVCAPHSCASVQLKGVVDNPDWYSWCSCHWRCLPLLCLHLWISFVDICRSSRSGAGGELAKCKSLQFTGVACRSHWWVCQSETSVKYENPSSCHFYNWFLCVSLQTVCFSVSGEILTARLRSQSFKAMMQQEIGWYDNERNSTDVLTTRLASDAGQVQGVSKLLTNYFISSGYIILSPELLTLSSH